MKLTLLLFLALAIGTAANSFIESQEIKYPDDFPEAWRTEWEEAVRAAREAMQEALKSPKPPQKAHRSCGTALVERVDYLCPWGCNGPVDLTFACSKPVTDEKLRDACCPLKLSQIITPYMIRMKEKNNRLD